MPRRIISSLVALVALAMFHGGCGNPVAPPPAPVVRTTVTLADTVLAPGDTIEATVRVVNRGGLGTTLPYSCHAFLWAEVEDQHGDCVAGCLILCVFPHDPEARTLNPGDVATETFRYPLFIDPGSRLPPGQYVVRGGIREYRRQYPWAQRRLTITASGTQTGAPNSGSNMPLQLTVAARNGRGSARGRVRAAPAAERLLVRTHGDRD